jgi:hypothetical protein
MNASTANLLSTQPQVELPLDKRDWIAGLEKGLSVIEAFDDAFPRMPATLESAVASPAPPPGGIC